MKPRRRTPAESDALVAHIPPAERRRILAEVLAILRSRGIDAQEFRDADGRSFVRVDNEQVKAVLGEEAARRFAQVADESPLPTGHTPPAA